MKWFKLNTDHKNPLSKLKVAKDLFKGVRFYVIGDILDEIQKLLYDGGAKKDSYLSHVITHVICDDHTHIEYSEASELFEVPVVTSRWVVMSVKCDILLPLTGFNPLNTSLFNNVHVCLAELGESDLMSVWGTIMYHGGHCQTELNKHITHLITTKPEGIKYVEGMKHDTIKIVTPDWLFDCVREKKILDVDKYHPQLLILEEPEPEPTVSTELVTKPTEDDVSNQGSLNQQIEDYPQQIVHAQFHQHVLPQCIPQPRQVVPPQHIQHRQQLSFSQTQPRHVFQQQSQQQRLYRPPLQQAGLQRPQLSHSQTHQYHPQQHHSLQQQQQLQQNQQQQQLQHLHAMHLQQQQQSQQQHHHQHMQLQQSQNQRSPRPKNAQLVHHPPNSFQQLPHQLPQHSSMPRQQLAHLTQQQIPVPQQTGQQLPHQTKQVLAKMVNNRMGAGRGLPDMATGRGLQEMVGQDMGVARALQDMAGPIPQTVMLMDQPQQHPNIIHSQGIHPMTAMQGMQPSRPSESPLPPTPGNSTPRTNSPRSPRNARAGGSQSSRGNSPRNTLRNITNNQSAEALQQHTKEVETKIQQIMDSISRASPQPLTPGRSNSHGKTVQDLCYYGHDAVDSIPGDLCLLGCVFYIADYSKTLATNTLETWKKVIEQFGGQIDNAYSNRVTHLLCSNQKTDVFQLALRDQKRVVTAHWLNDVLLKKRLMPPWLVTHFPSVYDEKKPCSNLIICQTNFEGEERKLVKRMLELIGAKYTGYMTRDNSALVCCKPEGTKYMKAKEWNIPIVSGHWLNELVLGNLDALKLPLQAQYQQIHAEDHFSLDLWRVSHLLNGWKMPLKVHKEIWKRFQGRINQAMQQQENLVGNNPMLQASKRKSPEVAYQGDLKRTRIGTPIPGAPCVMFTGIAKDKVTQLTQIVYELGGSVADSSKHCTHLVATSVQRTIKFLMCISTCQQVVVPEWLLRCSAVQRFTDPREFALIDKKAEEQFNFKLSTSMERARVRPLFQGFQFFITYSTTPGQANLKGMVESAGGTVLQKLPSANTVISSTNNKGELTCIVVTCDHDIHLCKHLTKRKISVFNAEFILTGIMRQELDYAHTIQPSNT